MANLKSEPDAKIRDKMDRRDFSGKVEQSSPGFTINYGSSFGDSGYPPLARAGEPITFSQSPMHQEPFPFQVYPGIPSDLDADSSAVRGAIYLPDGCFVYDNAELTFDSGYTSSIAERYQDAGKTTSWYMFTSNAIDVEQMSETSTPLYAHVLKNPKSGSMCPVRISMKDDPRTDSEKQTGESFLEHVTKIKICDVYLVNDDGTNYVFPARQCVESAVILSSGDGSSYPPADNISIDYIDSDDGTETDSETGETKKHSEKLEIKGWNDGHEFKNPDGTTKSQSKKKPAINYDIPSKNGSQNAYSTYEFVARTPSGVDGKTEGELVYLKIGALGSGSSSTSGSSESCKCSHKGNTSDSEELGCEAVVFESAYKGDGSDGKDNVEVRTWDDNGVKKITIGVYYV